jgi:site-specific recombinase XerD
MGERGITSWQQNCEPPISTGDNSPSVRKWLGRKADTYLDEISQVVPSPTYRSHKYKINDFTEWVQTGVLNVETIVASVAKFLTHLLKTTDYSLNTIQGYVYSLSNFAAYLHQDNPILIAARCLSRIQKQLNYTPISKIERLFGSFISNEAPSGISKKTIEGVIRYNRQSQFATRTHAYIETILETKARPRQVHQLDCPAFDDEQGVIELGISERYLVGKFNLVPMREVELSKKGREVLQNYMEHNRKGVSDSSDALFTTAQGRANPSTLRRSVKRASKKSSTSTHRQTISTSLSTEESTVDKGSNIVLPKDIWWYSITTMIE